LTLAEDGALLEPMLVAG